MHPLTLCTSKTYLSLICVRLLCHQIRTALEHQPRWNIDEHRTTVNGWIEDALHSHVHTHQHGASEKVMRNVLVCVFVLAAVCE